MKIRIIGSKAEIEEFCKVISAVYPDFVKSKLYPAREQEGCYRCYITVYGKESGERRCECQ